MLLHVASCAPGVWRPHPAHGRKPCSCHGGIGLRRRNVRSAAIQEPKLSIRAFWAATPRTNPASELQADADEAGAQDTLAEEVMLKRAASLLSRGTATCLTCKGKGTCPCPICKGAGLLSQAQMSMHPMKQAVRSVKSLMHATTERDWLISNRCRRCSAQGVLLCEVCRGSGLRYPNLIPNTMQSAGKPKD